MDVVDKLQKGEPPADPDKIDENAGRRRREVIAIEERRQWHKPEDTLTLETTKGNVVIAMRPDLAPGHVARIKELVKKASTTASSSTA